MNALVPTTNVETYRASTDAASVCKEIVVASASTIQGRRYVQVEGWQAIAVAHGCAASARDVERIDGGVRAIGEVRRMSDGQIIAQAEGFVGEDEAVWFGGDVTTKWGKKHHDKRPDYAIRAMAQTRAISRACRSAFAHVVVMMNAGLSTTPAEEVPLGGFDDEGSHAPAERPAPASAAPAGIKRLSSARAKELGKDKDFRRLVDECDTPEKLDILERNFDRLTAEHPLSWLDAMRNELILKREELTPDDRTAQYDAEFDAAFKGAVGPKQPESANA